MNQFGRDIVRFRTDNGGEYFNRLFRVFLAQHGINHEFTVPDTPQQNGVSERFNRTLFDMMRSNLIQSGVSRKRYWVTALKAACFIYNLVPHDSVDGKIPYELWYGRPYTGVKPQPFGCKAHLHIKKNKRSSKFDDVSVPGVLVGYDLSRKAYQILTIERYPRIVSSEDVSFPATVVFPLLSQNHDHISDPSERLIGLDDDDLLVPIQSHPDIPDHESSDPPTMDTQLEDDQYLVVRVIPQAEKAPAAVAPTGPPSASVSQSAPQQSAPPAPTEQKSADLPPRTPINTRANRARQADEEKRDNKPEPRYPKRARHTPIRLGEWIQNAQRPHSFVGLARVTKHTRDRDTPRTIEQAMKSRDWLHWKKAIEDELASLKLMHAWDVVTDLPKLTKLVKSGWVFKIKRDAAGNIIKYKARLVAKGYSQKYGQDYFETYAPVAQLASIRTLLSLAAEQDLDLHQFDVSTAFLHGRLEETVYMEPPPGSGLTGALSLKVGLYGLRQSAAVWNKTLTTALTKLGLVQNRSDPCVFTQRVVSSVLHLAVWVDDCIVATNDPTLREKLLAALRKEFRIPEVEELHWVLGMRVTRDRSRRILCVDQAQYTRDILERFGLDGVRPKDTPATSVKRPAAPHSPDCIICDQYREAVGSLRYLTDCTRPDIAYAVNLACRHTSDPQPEHCVAVKRIFRFLAGTMDYGLIYTGTPTRSPVIQAYADADYAGNAANSRSTSGYICRLSGAPVSWKSRLQRVVSQSTMESEYLAIGDAAKDVLWLRSFLSELGYPQSTTTIHNDNMAAIHLTRHQMNFQTTKHIAVRFHFIRDLVKENTLNVTYMKTAEMPADLLTKPVTEKIFNRLHREVVRPVPR
jgi:hypothetical protein